MTLIVFGINHHTASISVREQVAFAPEKVPEALHSLLNHNHIQEAVLLSTCNRTELYVFGSDLISADRPAEQTDNTEVMVDSDTNNESWQYTLSAWLAQHCQLPLPDVVSYCYLYTEAIAVKHIMRVASGLDSMVLGEPQILGQLKSSFLVAQDNQAIGSYLHRLFQHIFTTAKQVRTHTSIGENPVSVAYAAVSMARKIFTDLSQQTVLLIGAGETIDLVAKHLCDINIGKLLVANRTLQRADELAQVYGAEAILLADIPVYLPQADIVFSSTASQLPILGKGMVERALKQRRNKLMFMVDMAVPRDIETEVNTLNDVYLYTVDDLKDVVESNKLQRHQAALEAEKIITQNVELFLHKQQTLNAVDTIRSYRSKMEAIRDQELEKALVNLNKGQDTQLVMQRLARDLSHKMMHGPTLFLKQEGADKQDQNAALIQDIFDLNQ